MFDIFVRKNNLNERKMYFVLFPIDKCCKWMKYECSESVAQNKTFKGDILDLKPG